jgi:peptidoglycan hydrolase-like protein with peptidoglycan-binding domain
VTVSSTFDDATDTALRNFQTSRNLPVTGTTDALTWQAVLGLPLQPVTWTKK